MMSLGARILQGDVPRMYLLALPLAAIPFPDDKKVYGNALNIIPASSILRETKETLCMHERRFSLRMSLPLFAFGLPYAPQWGFGNVVKRLSDKDSNIVWVVSFPLLKDDKELFEKELLCVSATLQVIFIALNMSYGNIQEDSIQLLFIEGITTKPDKKDFSFNVLLLKAFFDWLDSQNDEVVRKLEDEMRHGISSVYERLTGTPFDFKGPSCILESESKTLLVPGPNTDGGSEISLHPSDPAVDDGGCKVLSYTLHSVVEQLIFLCSIAVLYDFVLSHTTQKEKSE